MQMALKTHRWTRADLARFPEDGNKYEVIDGDLLVTPAPRPAHEEIIQVFGTALDEYCRDTRIGRAYHGKPAMVTRDSEVQPDIVVRRRVIPPPDRWDDSPLPMLVVEVLSESSRRHDLVKKRSFYIETGVPEYWVVDGEARAVLVIATTGERLESRTLHWHPIGAEQRLELDLAALFAAALGASS